MGLFMPNIATYSHRTSEENAVSIMANGFLGTERLDYTTDQINDDISFNYFAGLHRKSYGIAIIIIQVSREIRSKNYGKLQWFQHFTDKVKMKQLEKELRDEEKYEGEGFDFLIPIRFIRGYILDEKLIENPEFNPYEK
jgi:hypothetical protein